MRQWLRRQYGRPAETAHHVPTSAGRLVVALTILSLLFPTKAICADTRRITVVLRYDDCSAHSASVYEERLIAALRKYRIHCTFAVIPYVSKGTRFPDAVEPLSRDKARMLLKGVRSGVLEVAQHGYSHEPTYGQSDGRFSEFDGLPYGRQREKLGKGHRLLEHLLGISVTTFVPPWDSYDSNTLRAIESLGFSAISPGMSSRPDARTALKILPDTCLLPDIEPGIISARASIDPHPVLVVLLHPQDLKEVDAREGMYTMEECEQALAWLQAQPDVRTCSIGEATRLIDGLDARRFSGCYGFIASTPGRLLPGSIPTLYYPSGWDLGGMFSRMWIRVTVFYAAVFIIAGALGFLLMELAAKKRRKTRQAVCYGILVPALLTTAFLLRRDVMQSGEAALLASALGFWIGSWTRLFGKARFDSVNAARVSRKTMAPQELHPKACGSGVRLSGREKRARYSQVANVCNQSAKTETGEKVVAGIVLATIALLPIVAWPGAKDPNLVKPVLLTLGLAAVYAVSTVTKARSSQIRFDWLDAAILGYTVVVCASWLYSDYRYATLGMITLVLPYTALYFTVRRIAASPRYRAGVALLLLCGGCVVSAIGIFEQAHILPWGTPWAIGSTWFNRTYLAAYLVAILPVALWASLRSSTAFRRVGLLTLMLGLPALVFTSARAAWLAPVPAIIVGCIGAMRCTPSQRHCLIYTAVLVLIVGVLALQLASDRIIPGLSSTTMSSLIGASQDWSNRGRLAYMSAAFAMGRIRPITGFGAGTYSIVGGSHLPPTSVYAHGEPVVGHAHNELLQIFGELGAIGLLASITIPLATGWHTYRLLRKPREDDGQDALALALFAGMVAFLSANLVGISARVPGELGFLYIFAGLVGAAASPLAQKTSRGNRDMHLGRSAMCALFLVLSAMTLFHINRVRASVLLLQGEALLKAGSDNAEWAMPIFRKACEIAGPNPEAEYDLANAYAMTGEWNSALRAYGVVEKLSPDYARVHFNQGTVLLYTGQYREALAEFEEAYRLDARADTLMRLNYARARLKEVVHRNNGFRKLENSIVSERRLR